MWYLVPAMKSIFIAVLFAAVPLTVLAQSAAPPAAGIVSQAPSAPTQAPDSDAFYRLGPESRSSEGRNSRAIYSTQHCLSGHAAPLLGLCSGAVRSRHSRQPDDLQRRAGVYEYGWRPAGAERDGQSHLPEGAAGDDRRVY